MYSPSLPEFLAHADQGNLIPVYREILADMETPVSAFRKIDDGHTSFLLESIEGGEKWARYSFLGSGPGRLFRSRDRHYEILDGDRIVSSGEGDDPLAELQRFMAPYRPVQLPGLPRFFGGAVGYLGYDMVRFVEALPDANPREIGAWDACFLLTEKLLIFDNMRQKIKVVCNVHLQPRMSTRRPPTGGALDEIETLIARLREPLPRRRSRVSDAPAAALEPNVSRRNSGRRWSAARSTSGPATSSRWSSPSVFPGRWRPIPSTSTGRCAPSTPPPTCSSCASARPWWSAPPPRCWCARRGSGSRCAPSPAPGRAGRNAEEDARAGGGAARRPQGVRRAHHAGRPGAQRRRPGLPAPAASRSAS